MSTDTKNKIGSLIYGPASRDAVHVAVAPCMAGEDLKPGARVGIAIDGSAFRFTTRDIGIVDPFLAEPVSKGERFWLFLYPGTAQNLRHEWDHPDLPTEPPDSAEVAASKMWLQVYATGHELTLQNLLVGTAKYVSQGSNPDPVFDDDYKNFDTPDEFWQHYKTVTGETGKGNIWGCCI